VTETHETVEEERSGGGDAAGAAPDQPAAEALQETPEEMAARIGELTSDLQRLQAEYVNYKRRVDRDRDLVLQNAKYAILSALLPVLDDVDRAREHGEVTGGFKAVADSLERIVTGEGLVKFGARGDAFDPRLHEALMHSLSADVATTTCDKIVQAGYQFGDRVMRPALVTVVDPDPAAAPASDGQPTAVTDEAADVQEPGSQQPAAGEAPEPEPRPGIDERA